MTFGQTGIKTIITKHNLPSLTVRTSYQKMLFDRNGLMYIATSDGIVLYNGVTESFIQGSEIIVNHRVSSMVQDHQGIIWLGCEDGTLFKIVQGELKMGIEQFEPFNYIISKLLVDQKNHLWIATKGNGVYEYNGAVLKKIIPENGMIPEEITDIHLHKNGGMVIIYDLGMKFLQHKEKQYIIEDLNLSCLRRSEIIQNISLVDNLMYFNNLSAGIAQWDMSTNECHFIWKNSPDEYAMNVVASQDYQVVFSDKKLYIWFSGLSNFSVVKTDLKFSDIQNLAIDKNNTLWVLHKTRGLLSIFLPISLFEIDKKIIQSISMTSDEKNLLLCTDSGLQIIRVHDGHTVKLLFPNENLTSIYKENNKDIFWIGSYGKGLIHYNLSNNKISRFKKEDGLPDNNILHLAGNDQYVWIATLAGILRTNINKAVPGFKNVKEYNLDNGLPTHFIYQMAPDIRGRIWLGTDGNGIHYFDAKKTIVKKLAKVDGTSSVYSILYSDQDVLYFNGSKQGLAFYNILLDSIKWLNSTVKNVDFECLSLLNDSVLLAAGNGFLLQTNIRESLSILMDEEFGLADIIPSLNAIYKDKSSNIWIGCKNSVLRVQPNILTIISKPGNSFSSIKVVNNEILPGKNSVFSSENNQISFEFTAVHYLASDHLDYRSRLIGYDKEWNYSKVGKESYSNISPGYYQFVVQSSINKHFDNSNEIQYSFRILKPFWKTWWFIIFILLVFMILIRLFIKRRELIKTKEEEHRRKTSELQFELLKAQVNPHFLFNSFNSVISLIEEDKNRAIVFTESLSDYFRNILEYRDIPLIPLYEEMNLLINYLNLLELRHPQQIQFEKGIINNDAFIAPMTLQLLMENAIKHNEISIQHPLKIKLFCTKDSLFFTNKILRKKSEVDSTGFGLEGLQFRYELLTDKKIKIDRLQDTFTIEIPLIFT